MVKLFLFLVFWAHRDQSILNIILYKDFKRLPTSTVLLNHGLSPCKLWKENIMLHYVNIMLPSKFEKEIAVTSS